MAQWLGLHRVGSRGPLTGFERGHDTDSWFTRGALCWGKHQLEGEVGAQWGRVWHFSHPDRGDEGSGHDHGKKGSP